MTASKIWQNSWIIGEKDKSYVKFKEKLYNNLPLDSQYRGGLGSYLRFNNWLKTPLF